MDGAWYVRVRLHTLRFTGVFAYESRADWTYIALPTTEIFRMPFTEHIDLMREALRVISWARPHMKRKPELIKDVSRPNGSRCSSRLTVCFPRMVL